MNMISGVECKRNVRTDEQAKLYANNGNKKKDDNRKRENYNSQYDDSENDDHCDKSDDGDNERR